MEQDKNNQIIELKQNLGLLREQLNQQIDNVKKFETALNNKEKELNLLSDRLENMAKVKNDCQD